MLVIVGGGFAGLEAAVQIRTLRPSREVALITAGPSLVYKPWLIYVPAGRRRFAEVCIPLAPLAARYGFQLIDDRVDQIDLDARRVGLAKGRVIDYSQLLLATGADADRNRIPGADQHAFFPCQPDDAEKFAVEVHRRMPKRICVAVGWDRRGPGLEFAGWLATRRKRLGAADMEVVVVDGDGLLADHYGAEAMAAIRSALMRAGATWSTESVLNEVTASAAVVGGKDTAFDLVAIVAPLCGVNVGLPVDMLDDRGFIRVDESFATTRPGIFAFGDAAALPSKVATGKTMVSIRQRVAHLASNVLADMDGEPLKPLEPTVAPHRSMANIGGHAILLRDNRVIGQGRMPLLRRWLYRQSYFRLRS